MLAVQRGAVRDEAALRRQLPASLTLLAPPWCPYLPISPHISPYLPISPHISVRASRSSRRRGAYRTEIWGDMGRYGEIWGDMGGYGAYRTEITLTLALTLTLILTRALARALARALTRRVPHGDTAVGRHGVRRQVGWG